MKNFNHYAGREEFSAFKDFFLTHGQCKEMKKKDVDTGDFLPQGDAKLDGAVYGLYAKEDIDRKSVV